MTTTTSEKWTTGRCITATWDEHLRNKFWSKVDKNGDCWLWKASVHKKRGWGRINVQGHHLLAHRIAYELAKGLIPEGRTIVQTCGNRVCTNPEHIRLAIDGTTQRFWKHVHKTTTCWNWTASVNWAGYGLFSTGDHKKVSAHRFAYMLIKGNIPADKQLDHLCRNRKCVNPDHLEAVTCRENLLRGDTLNAAAVKKTHCVHGHPLAGDNLIMAELIRTGRRSCLTCKRERSKLRVIKTRLPSMEVKT